MTTETMQEADQAGSLSLSILHELLSGYPSRNFAVRLWNGTTWDAEAGQPTRFTLVLKHPSALRKMFLPPTELTMAEAYIYDDFDIEGDCEAIQPLADYFKEVHWCLAERLHFGKELHNLPADGHRRPGRRPAEMTGFLHSRERDRHAVTYHYDTSNDFFRLFLDERMVYSCAYFESPEEDLDTAQQRKLDYICRKLRLQPGERLLDIGCGWGGLIIHAAKNYGARALGITLSQPQATLARERVLQAGLSDRCRVEVRDYRDIDEPAPFDKLVSVGMFEHVGEMRLPEYFQQAWRLLKPKGVFLNHAIARSVHEAVSREVTFSDKYVFPDGEQVPLHTTLHIAEKSGFEVRDVESLREHYVRTLRLWLRRLEEHHDEAAATTDETTYRVWRLFMSGSAHRFERGRLNVYQTLLVKSSGGESGLPLTRKDWYT